MTHPIIKTQNYLLVVDDESEIKEGEKGLSINNAVYTHFNRLGKDYGKKVIAHLPLKINAPILEGVPLLPPLKISEVAYDECQLVARKENVYNTDGKFMFSVSMTDKAKGLVDNDGWEKGKESWLDYRKRTEAERELEKQKQYKLAAYLAEAFNNKAKEKYKGEIQMYKNMCHELLKILEK
jgi:hypothetical protein